MRALAERRRSRWRRRRSTTLTAAAEPYNWPHGLRRAAREAADCRGNQSDERERQTGARVPGGSAKPSDGLCSPLPLVAPTAGKAFGRNGASAVSEAVGGGPGFCGGGAESETAHAARFRRNADHARSAPLSPPVKGWKGRRSCPAAKGKNLPKRQNRPVLRVWSENRRSKMP